MQPQNRVPHISLHEMWVRRISQELTSTHTTPTRDILTINGNRTRKTPLLLG
jgi:hypothetical protein